MFGDINSFIPLDKLSLLITKGASPKWQGVCYTTQGVLFVTSENVREGYLDCSQPKYLEEKINNIQPRSILQKNDILINIVGASIGRVAIYNLNELANINQAVCLVRIDTKQANLQYILSYLNSDSAQKSYHKMKKGGARDNLSLKNISDLLIPQAPLSLQNEFARFVEQTDKSKVLLEKSATILLKLINLVFYLVYIEKSNVLCYNIHSTEEL